MAISVIFGRSLQETVLLSIVAKRSFISATAELLLIYGMGQTDRQTDGHQPRLMPPLWWRRAAPRLLIVIEEASTIFTLSKHFHSIRPIGSPLGVTEKYCRKRAPTPGITWGEYP